jgi:two-component system, LytTR family, response regulator
MTAEPAVLSAYLVDDEPLALKRLERLLRATPWIRIAGSATNAKTALQFLASERVDVLLLDIQMPGLNGFELLDRLPTQPMVIFTTAYDQYALKAFEVNSIDYLLKPVDPKQLDRALKKLAQRNTTQMVDLSRQLQALASQIAAQLKAPVKTSDQLDRVYARVGDRVVFFELEQITHFCAENRLTYLAIGSQKYVVDYSLSELEEKLSDKGFARIHRATLVNLSLVDEIHRWFGGRLLLRLKDKNRTELTVSRDQVKALKDRLGLR